MRIRRRPGRITKENYMDINKIYDMTEDEVKQRIKDLDNEVMAMDKLEDVQAATVEKRALVARREEIREARDRKARTIIMNGGMDPNPASVSNVVARENNMISERNNKNMDNENIEIRSFQKYITGGMKTMTDVEQRALAVSGSAAVMPVLIAKELITGSKYSDLLHRATVFEESGASTLKVPIASATAASWKIENSSVDGEAASYEAAPTLTSLDLKGYELYRWMRISAAASSLSTGNFQEMMLELLASEVIEALEKSFIDGTGTGQPKGLESLTWNAGNKVTTTNSSTPIAASHIAEALSFLPQRHARNAIILVNADTLYNISMFKGTSEYAFDLSTGATKFMGHDIIVNEHVADDTVYIVNPKGLYVRFAAPIQVEANNSSGFTSAAIDLRALCVADAQWDPSACVSVGLGA